MSVVIDVVLFGGVVVFTTDTAVVLVTDTTVELVTDTTVELVRQRVKLILVAIVVLSVVSILVTMAIVLVAESDHSRFVIRLWPHNFIIFVVIIGLTAAIDLMLILLHIVLINRRYEFVM